MARTFRLTNPALPFLTRLPFLLIGLPVLLVGLYALLQTTIAGFDIVTGRPFEGYFILGVAIGILGTVLGGMAVGCFFLPGEELCFDADRRVATLSRTYPFGFKREWAYDFASMSAPEVVWHRDSESSEGGFWALKVTLPNGKILHHASTDWSIAKQKAAAEDWRASIVELMR